MRGSAFASAARFVRRSKRGMLRGSTTSSTRSPRRSRPMRPPTVSTRPCPRTSSSPAPDMHERIVGLYEENAAAWDRQRGRDLFEKAWLDRFLALLPEAPELLDVGCRVGEAIA